MISVMCGWATQHSDHSGCHHRTRMLPRRQQYTRGILASRLQQCDPQWQPHNCMEGRQGLRLQVCTQAHGYDGIELIVRVSRHNQSQVQ